MLIAYITYFEKLMSQNWFFVYYYDFFVSLLLYNVVIILPLELGEKKKPKKLFLDIQGLDINKRKPCKL